MLARLVVLAFGIWLAALPPTAFADDARDKMLKDGLVGYWTVPMDATDAQDRQFLSWGHNAVVQYRYDGTGHVTGYLDQTCTKSFNSIDFTWAVINSILITTYPSGSIDHDELLNVDANSYEFRDGKNPGRTPRRVKAHCGMDQNS